MLLVFAGLNAVISLVGGIQVEDLGTRVQLGYTVDVYGVESICRVLPIAPSTYYRHAQKLQQPTLRVKRCVSDACLLAQIQTVWNDGLQVYGYWKVWRQLLRQGVQVALLISYNKFSYGMFKPE